MHKHLITHNCSAGTKTICLWDYGICHYYMQWQDWNPDSESGEFLTVDCFYVEGDHSMFWNISCGKLLNSPWFDCIWALIKIIHSSGSIWKWEVSCCLTYQKIDFLIQEQLIFCYARFLWRPHFPLIIAFIFSVSDDSCWGLCWREKNCASKYCFSPIVYANFSAYWKHRTKYKRQCIYTWCKFTPHSREFLS